MKTLNEINVVQNLANPGKIAIVKFRYADINPRVTMDKFISDPDEFDPSKYTLVFDSFRIYSMIQYELAQKEIVWIFEQLESKADPVLIAGLRSLTNACFDFLENSLEPVGYVGD